MTDKRTAAKWFHYPFAFLAGIFLTNAVPHFVMGVTGHLFPTPFASPPGVGLSTSVENVLWATINILLGMLFFYFGKIKSTKTSWIGLAFYLANYFGSLNLYS